MRVCVHVYATMLHPCTATQTTLEKKAPAAADPYQNESTGVLPSSAGTVQKHKESKPHLTCPVVHKTIKHTHGSYTSKSVFTEITTARIH